MGYKRIIDGKTYNTSTATLVHEIPFHDEAVYEGLYQTPHEAFFIYWYNSNFEEGGIKPISDDEALAWLEKCKAPAATIEQFFSSFPEAGAAERRLTLRLPGNLYNRVAASAEAAKVSLNTYIMRQLERSERPELI